MIDYDFLSDSGQGWERDAQELAKWLKPEQRHRVAICLHGWYDALSSYCFDATTKQLKTEWVAFGQTRGPSHARRAAAADASRPI
jgi:hypothetical protein